MGQSIVIIYSHSHGHCNVVNSNVQLPLMRHSQLVWFLIRQKMIAATTWWALGIYTVRTARKLVNGCTGHGWEHDVDPCVTWRCKATSSPKQAALAAAWCRPWNTGHVTAQHRSHRSSIWTFEWMIRLNLPNHTANYHAYLQPKLRSEQSCTSCTQRQQIWQIEWEWRLQLGQTSRFDVQDCV